jgi:hypothetical protein
MPEIIKIKYQNQFKVPGVLASAEYVIPIPEGVINTHNYFNDLTILNTDAVDIEVTPDNDSTRSFIVPNKTSFNWSFKNDNLKFSRLKLTNLSALTAITANKIQFIILKKKIEVTGEGV